MEVFPLGVDMRDFLECINYTNRLNKAHLKLDEVCSNGDTIPIATISNTKKNPNDCQLFFSGLSIYPNDLSY